MVSWNEIKSISPDMQLRSQWGQIWGSSYSFYRNIEARPDDDEQYGRVVEK